MCKPLTPIERFLCLFLLAIWSGGMWLSILAIFPALSYTILAPILIANVTNELAARIVIVVTCCTVVVLVLYLKAIDYKQFKSSPAIIMVLITALILELLLITNNQSGLLGYQMMAYCYLAIAVCGVFALVNFFPWLHEQSKKYLMLKAANQ